MHTAKHKGPVVGRPISINPRLNFNLCFFIPSFKSLFGIIFCVLRKAYVKPYNVNTISTR